MNKYEKTAADANEAAAPEELEVIRADQVKLEKIDWLWPGRYARQARSTGRHARPRQGPNLLRRYCTHYARPPMAMRRGTGSDGRLCPDPT